MTSHTATMRETAAAKWAAAKSIAFGLAIGLAAGPVISGLAGHLGPRRLPGPDQHGAGRGAGRRRRP
jgi:hypothetical protein